MAGFEAYEDFAAWRTAQARDASGLDASRVALEALRRSLTAEGIAGHCVLCDAQRRFRCPELVAGTVPSFREGLLCEACRCNARQRAAGALLLADGIPGASYVTEHASPLFLALRRRVPRLVGSEFAPWHRRLRLSAWLWRRRVPAWVRAGDVTALRFETASLDAVISLDVLEHVPDYRAALREFARVSRPGGQLVLSVPFYADREATATLARIADDGRIEHLQPPEYHGDPLGGGVLCFHHFGWDLLAALREAGFASAEAVRMHDLASGCPEPLWLVRARR